MNNQIFINWPIDDNSLSQCNLFDAIDLTEYKIVFLDPLNFAVKNQLRENEKDISIAEYNQLTKDEFIRFTARIKKSIQKLDAFLDAGGLLVIRSNIPNSYIKIREHTVSGSQMFTESVIPAFFWMEELIGKYTFTYSLTNLIEFTDTNNALYKTFNRAPFFCRQTQNVISKYTTQVLARSKSQHRLPVITRVSRHPDQGEIFFIPNFEVKNETAMLITAFTDIYNDINTGSFKPGWLKKYEAEISLNSPYVDQVSKINKKIELLNKQRSALIDKHDEILNIASILSLKGNKLANAVKVAMEYIGFTCSEIVSKKRADVTDFYIEEGSEKVGLVKAVSSDTGSVSIESYIELVEKIEKNGYRKKIKGILIANSYCSLPPDKRQEWFDQEILETNEQYRFCLITTFELYNIILYLLSKFGSEILKTIQASLRKDILTCESEFAISHRKYNFRIPSI